MPVARYFLYVGGVLLALLFAINAFVPQELALASHSAPGIDKSTVRIHSTQKLPERVVYDTSLPTIVPPVAKTQVAAAPPAPVTTTAHVGAQTTAQARVRDTFAQFVPAEPRKMQPQVQHKRKITRVRLAPQAQPPVRLAQQSHFGFFGGPSWNSTW
jgi:hypothetical protein